MWKQKWMQLNRFVLLSIALVGFSGSSLAAEALHVRHDHDPWGSCTGELTIASDGIRYHSDDKDEHSRDWSWTDIQTVDRLSADRFSILTYQDQKWLLGRDRPWDFTVLDPEAGGLTDQLFTVIRRDEPRPLVDRVPRKMRPTTGYRSSTCIPSAAARGSSSSAGTGSSTRPITRRTREPGDATKKW